MNSALGFRSSNLRHHPLSHHCRCSLTHKTLLKPSSLCLNTAPLFLTNFPICIKCEPLRRVLWNIQAIQLDWKSLSLSEFSLRWKNSLLRRDTSTFLIKSYVFLFSLWILLFFSFCFLNEYNILFFKSREKIVFLQTSSSRWHRVVILLDWGWMILTLILRPEFRVSFYLFEWESS